LAALLAKVSLQKLLGQHLASAALTQNVQCNLFQVATAASQCSLSFAQSRKCLLDLVVFFL
jgi:hypothetical protein